MPTNNLESSRKPIRILALCDSPVVSANAFVVSTGFGRVARNILGEWTRPQFLSPEKGDCLDCWAINFNGWGYDKSPFRLFPSNSRGGRWNSAANLQDFLRCLAEGGYTHVWLLMDPDALSVHGFPAALKKVCAEHGIRSLLYYPVDSTLEREWLAILDAVDVAVTYTEFGKTETRRAIGKSLYPVSVIPHGVDAVFRRCSIDSAQEYRKVQVNVPGKAKPVDFIQPHDFFILSVNKNEWRKDPLRSLEILKGLRSLGVPAKLVLRMAPASAMGGIQIEPAARQLGLEYGREYIHISDISDENLCGLYNAADLYLTTSMGEGWGLGVTEALACGCPVAMAAHTSLKEIGRQYAGENGEGVLWLPLEDGYVCGADTRLRRRVDLPGAVGIIHDSIRDHSIGGGLRFHHSGLPVWPEVAANMFKLLVG